MPNKYILDGKTPRAEPDLRKWAAWFETADRIVAKGKFGEVLVSTVFLGTDHQFGDGDPLLFETMIFGGPRDEDQWRCSTWAEAEEQHERACEIARGSLH